MQPPVNFQGFSSIPGVPGELMNSIVQSVLQAHGQLMYLGGGVGEGGWLQQRSDSSETYKC